MGEVSADRSGDPVYSRIALLRAEQGVTRREHIQKRLKPGDAGALINALRDKAAVLETLPRVDDSPDPDDNNILAAAIAGEAQYLVTGDKNDLQALVKVQGVRILAVGEFVTLFG